MNLTYPLILFCVLPWIFLTPFARADASIAALCPSNKQVGRVFKIFERTFISQKNSFYEVSQRVTDCVSCHDGSLAPGIPLKEGVFSQEVIQEKSFVGLNHPVNVPYPDQKEGFTPKALLDANLVLENGKITCYTCHSDTTRPYALSIQNDKSNLCLACHQQ